MNKACTFENFALGISNEAAVNVCKKYISGDMNESVISLYGESGNGKTHLALACKNAAENMGKKVLYESAQWLSAEICTAFFKGEKDLYKNVLPEYQKYDVLIIDDLRGLSGKEVMQEFFYELIKSYITSGKKVILTLDKKDYKSYLEMKLSKPIQEIYAVEILEPDHKLLMNVLQGMKKTHEVSLSSITEEFMCTQVKSVEELCDLFQRGMFLSQCLGREMDADLIYAVLED